jgi:hypothetical protein
VSVISAVPYRHNVRLAVIWRDCSATASLERRAGAATTLTRLSCVYGCPLNIGNRIPVEYGRSCTTKTFELISLMFLPRYEFCTRSVVSIAANWECSCFSSVPRRRIGDDILNCDMTSSFHIPFNLLFTRVTYKLTHHNSALSRVWMWVTIDGVSIGNRTYWTLTTRNYK